MNRAHLSAGSSLQALPSPAFNFGTGDFTVMAMLAAQQGGTLVARKGTAGGPGNGGFLLVVNPDSSVKLATDNGFGYYQVLTGPTGILDGQCHAVAGIRTGPTLTIYIDGFAVAAAASGNATAPLDVNNSLPLTLGCTQQMQEPSNQFIGGLMNVSVWNTALEGDAFVRASFARINGSEAHLQGYWTLDATTQDLSPNGNSASIVGIVTYEHCFACVWAGTDNAYRFSHISNMPDVHAPSGLVSLTRVVTVPPGSPALAMSILSNVDQPMFPAGAQVTVQDPTGVVYNQNQNTATVFAAMSEGQLWSLMVVNPAAGSWRVSVTAPGTCGFDLYFHTVPVAAVVQTARQALNPLYLNAPPHAAAHGRLMARQSLGGFWDMVAAIAVGAVVGVIAAGAVILTGGAALPAVAAGVAAFAFTENLIVGAALHDINADSRLVSTGQVAGMAGFVVAADKFLLFDANVDADQATKIIYSQRNKRLYPKVTASSFNQVRSQLIGPDVNRVKVGAALNSFSSGYVTGGGHGMEFYLMGWTTNGPDSPLEEVIAKAGAARFTEAQVQGKIFHFFACRTGYAGSAAIPGLGRAMVAAGAVAFFGYNVPFQLDLNNAVDFCKCDIDIDLQMLAGASCDVAYTHAIALFDSTIASLKISDPQGAARLQANRNALVSPSTDPMYGNKTAFLRTR